MATYAAMIEIVDSGIGELVETIKEKGMLDNTVFIFLSDNGATKEGGYLGQLMADLSNTPYRSLHIDLLYLGIVYIFLDVSDCTRYNGLYDGIKQIQGRKAV